MRRRCDRICARAVISGPDSHRCGGARAVGIAVLSAGSRILQCSNSFPPPSTKASCRSCIGTARFAPLVRNIEDALVAPWLGSAGQSAFIARSPKATSVPLLRSSRCTARSRCRPIVWGERDLWIPGERGLELAQQIVGGPLELVCDAGHLFRKTSPSSSVAFLRTTSARSSHSDQPAGEQRRFAVARTSRARPAFLSPGAPDAS